MLVDKAGATSKVQPKVPVIDPRAVFTIPTATSTLELAKSCLPREIRLGRLRAAKRAGKYFVLGGWLLEWLEGGEVRRRPAASRRPAEGAA